MDASKYHFQSPQHPEGAGCGHMLAHIPGHTLIRP